MFKVFRGRGRTYSAVTVAETSDRRIRKNLSSMIYVSCVKVRCNNNCTATTTFQEECTTPHFNLLFYHHPLHLPWCHPNFCLFVANLFIYFCLLNKKYYYLSGKKKTIHYLNNLAWVTNYNFTLFFLCDYYWIIGLDDIFKGVSLMKIID